MTEDKKEKKPRGPAKTFDQRVKEARDAKAKQVVKLKLRVEAKEQELKEARDEESSASAELKRMDAMLGVKA